MKFWGNLLSKRSFLQVKIHPHQLLVTWFFWFVELVNKFWWWWKYSAGNSKDNLKKKIDLKNSNSLSCWKLDNKIFTVCHFKVFKIPQDQHQKHQMTKSGAWYMFLKPSSKWPFYSIQVIVHPSAQLDFYTGQALTKLLIFTCFSKFCVFISNQTCG